jgi:cytoskeleton protein RodZ
MTIEGLGKKFQEARLARGLTLDEAARMTKIRPSRLGEIEADDFSQFPSLAYAKGFLLIYGKFLDVDITPYLEAFETSDAVTVDGYSYLQDNPEPAPTRAPVVRRRAPRVRAPSSSPSGGERTSLLPLILGVAVIVIGFLGMKLFLNLQRLAPRRPEAPVAAQTPAVAPAATAAAMATSAPAQAAATAPPVAATPAPAAPPPTAAPTTAPVVAAASPPPAAAPAAMKEPEVRRAEPVRPEDLAKANTTEATGPNRVAIKPLKKTYIKVVVDDEATVPAFERWISPTDGVVEFRGQKVDIRLLDPTAVQIKKNGKALEDEDDDVTVE